MNFRAICLIFSLCALNAETAAASCAKLHQGEILLGSIPEAVKIMHNGKELRLDGKGNFLFAAERDAAQQLQLEAVMKDGSEAAYLINVLPTAWDIQNLKGVQPRKVTPKPEDEAAILKEQTAVRGALKDNSSVPNWHNGFIMPVKGRTSGQFGGQRIMNGVKKNPHSGMDIAAPVGTEVKASGDGTVVLAAPDLFYSGNVMIIDHGFGLYTIYAHLNDFVAKEGDFVKKGDIIAHVGKTGRVTGPHLHWGASLQGVKFNPQTLLNLNQESSLCLNPKQQ